jgi:hypothetical protein
MSAPVDVRAVIRAVIEELRATGNTGHVQNLLDADVAVVELIEAANRARSILALHDDRCPQLEAALVNVGGAS